MTSAVTVTASVICVEATPVVSEVGAPAITIQIIERRQG